MPERIDAQRAIEQVYYRHLVGAAEPFERAVPESTIERKVRTYLKQSAALESIWHAPLNAQALRQEWKRIVRDTRFPDRLREIYDALGNDPLLFQECFVRPLLADRLSRNFFASDSRIQGPAREEAEQLRGLLERSALNPFEDHPNRRLEALSKAGTGSMPGHAERIGGAGPLPEEEFERRLETLPGRVGEVGPLVELDDAYLFSVPLELSSRRILVANYVVSKVGWDSWWGKAQEDLDETGVRAVADASPDTRSEGLAGGEFSESAQLQTAAAAGNTGCIPADSWTRGMEEKLPAPRYDHTAVWTGTEMLIWGGAWGASSNAAQGNRYDPLTDTWRAISRINAPAPRYLHTAVWTGSRMLIWGGTGNLNTGGRYDPISDTWSPISTVGAPEARYGHTAVWTGSRMVVWGGSAGGSLYNNGGRYDPATDTWMSVASAGLIQRVYHTAVWTGSRMIIWGGQSMAIPDPPNTTTFTLDDGKLYDPVSNLWTDMATLNRPASRRLHTALWTGNRMLIWGGDRGTVKYDDGGMYDPVNGWTPIPSFPPGRIQHAAAWTGGKMLIWGGNAGNPPVLNTGGLFDPASGTWTATSTAGAPLARKQHTIVWTGDKAIVWGGKGDIGAVLGNGGRYDPLSDAWTPTSMQRSGPENRSSFGAVWSGTHLIVWGGSQWFTFARTNTGSRYDPLTDAWSPTSTVGAPTPRYDHAAVWAGTRMIVWGGSDQPSTATATGGRYDPIADTWADTTLSGAPAPRDRAQAIWTGSEMILMGYGFYGSLVFDGYRYSPTADSWTPLSTVNQPEPRKLFSMTWDGSEVLVWGGQSQSTASDLNTGGAYDPSSGQWSAMSTVGAPSPREEHSAIWTGAELLVWGGIFDPFGSTTVLGDGARYNPVNHQWSPLNATGAPSARIRHAAVWTGTEMFIWGGMGLGSLNNGRRYSPTTQQWAPTSQTGAPAAGPVGGFWSGQFLLLWGSDASGSGGVYAPSQVDGDRDGDGHFACSGDCDDSDPAIHPGATEICNLQDDDCDGLSDEAVDADQDGYFGCAGGPDCNDANAAIHPGAPEICDGLDNDCDGNILENADSDGDGSTVCGGDCNDANPTIYPGAPETCNQADDDCDQVVDEVDQDADGYSGCGTDCNDSNPAVHPTAAEVCNGIDDNCATGIDEGFPDVDGDGYASCVDCSDSNGSIHPGAPEVCNNLDDDCNSFIDDGLDLDGDGHSSCFGGDCDDQEPGVWSAPSEVQNLHLQAGALTQLDWSDMSSSVGPLTFYDVYAGSLSTSPGINFSSTTCLSLGQMETSYTDLQASPSTGSGFWYLLRALNPCGIGTFGAGSDGQERIVPDCP